MGAIRTETDPRGVTRITLSRPERKNAFDADMISALAAAARAVAPNGRAVILGADGDAFCAGADLNWMKSTVDASLEENRADSLRLADMFRALDELPMPLLARVQGVALGGGAGLVAVTDIAVAAADASIGFTEVRVGIIPAVVSPYVVRKIGAAHATTLFTSGIRVNAERAREIGLVEAVAPPAELDAKVEEYVAAILAGGPEAIVAAKRMVREVSGRPVAGVREITAQRIAERRISAEGQEGMRAFLERRKPRWNS